MDSAEQTQSPDQQPTPDSADIIDDTGMKTLDAFSRFCYEQEVVKNNHPMDSEGNKEISSKNNQEEEERSKSLDQQEVERRQEKTCIPSPTIDDAEAGPQEGSPLMKDFKRWVADRERLRDHLSSSSDSESVKGRFVQFMFEPRFSRRSSSSSSRRADSSPNREIVQLASIKETIEADKTTQSDLESLITAKLTQCRVIFDFSCDPLSDLRYKVCICFLFTATLSFQSRHLLSQCK